VARELQSSDVLIVSSRAENTPLVIIEAASQGCLSVVSQVGGMPGMIDDLGAGEVFSDEGELVRVLARCAETPASQRSHSRTTLQAQAQTLYSVEAVLAQYDTQYD
jgi:glycosyltransferase involved in cell wall biosynthesis